MDLLTPHLYSRELTGVPQHIILKTYLAIIPGWYHYNLSII